MRIVQAVGWYFPERLGGTEVYVAALAERLRNLDHDVQIVAPEPGAAAPRQYIHEGIPVFRFPIRTPLTRDEAQGRAPVDGSEWFHRWVRAARPDVVHFHTLVPGLELDEIKAAKAAGARVIATTHASSLGYVCARGTMLRWGQVLCDGLTEPHKCAACDLQKRGLPKWAASAAAAVPVWSSHLGARLPGKLGTALGMPSAIVFNMARQRELLAAVDRFVLLTAWSADAVIRNGAPGSKVAVNRLGIGGTFVRKPGPSIRPTTIPVKFGYLGRFDPIKGLYDLGRALQSLQDDVPFHFDIRGPLDTPESRQVHERLGELLAGDARVTVGPAVPAACVPAHLASLDVLCCPSACLEGGPTVAIEAHAAGTPVVGTRIGGLAELVTDGRNGRLVPPGDWRALATAITEIAGDPRGTVDAWRTAIPAARTMDQVTADYVALYRH
ncbi:MAG: glycosyltransferase [Vicinamibacterales bacterium]